MRIRIGNGLLPLNLLAWLLVLINLLTESNILTIILGTPFVLFFPGYALMVALFPGREEMGGVERASLSFAASIAVVPLIGLVVFSIPWGINVETVLISVVLYILITSLVAWFRWRRLPASDRFGFDFQLSMQDWHGGIWGRALSVFVALAVLGAFATVSYVIAMPKQGEPFTELYVLGPEGNTIGYPGELAAGEQGSLIVGIVNNEQRQVSYRVEVVINSMKIGEAGPVVVEDGETWEGGVDFAPLTAGENQRVEFRLYESGGAEPLLEPIHIWINVRE